MTTARLHPVRWFVWGAMWPGLTERIVDGLVKSLCKTGHFEQAAELLRGWIHRVDHA